MVMCLRIGHRRYVLYEGINSIGRDSASTVCVNDSSISRSHARITVVDGQATVEDLKSKNGTKVQEQTIQAPTRLNDGDELEFGHVKGWFIVEMHEDPPTTTNL